MDEPHFGYLAWYQVSSGGVDAPLDITLTQLKAWFEELELNSAFLPLPPKGIDVFRTACAAIPLSYETGLERVKLSVQESSRSSGQVTRHIIRSGTEIKSGKVTSSRVAELLFLRPRRTNAGRVHGSESVQTMIHPGLSAIDYRQVQQAIAAFEERYLQLRDYITPADARSILRGYLVYLDAIPIPSANIWFLPPDRLPEVRRLQDLTGRLGPRCAFHVAPLTDSDEQRKMLIDAIEQELEDQCRILLGLIHRWMEDNPDRHMPVLRFAAFRTDYRGIKARVEEYEKLLDVELHRSRQALAGIVAQFQSIHLATEV